MKKLIVFLFLVALFFSFQVKAQEEIIKIPEWSESVLGFSSSPDNSLAFVWGEHYLYFSRNNNLNIWFPVTVGFAKINDLIVVNNSTVLMIGDKGIIIMSNDAGIHWELLSAPTQQNLNRIKVTGQGLFILGDNGFILKSTDSGVSWEDVSVNSSSSLKDINFFHSSYRGLVVGDKESFRTIDSGNSWSLEPVPYNMSGIRISMPDVPGLYPDFHDVHYIIGEGDFGGDEKVPAIIKRNREGLLLTFKIPESYKPNDIKFKGLTGYAIANKSDGLFLKTIDGGLTWTSEYRGSKLYSVSIHGERVILTGDNGTIYIRTLLTGISTVNSSIPNGFCLSQNYPNPFNPVTKINFSVPINGKVRLAVYNTAGIEVSILLNRRLSVGSYALDFDATNLTSGVYFYTLQSESFNDTKKMVLIK